MTQTKKASEEQISVRAYELYMQRNGSEGSAVEDWLRAETELNQKMAHESESNSTNAKPFSDSAKASIAKAGGA